MNKTLYDETFYETVADLNYPSAKLVAPVVCELVSPKSVIDFGCAVGSWLRAFDECGPLDRMLGLDGEWLKGKRLLIPEECIEYADFTERYELPEGVRFDLAVCLEVAEHIDEASGEILLDNLVKASDVVLFSAAIPLQGGTGHINEQWQSYWIHKFELRNYICLDALRPLFWDKPEAGIYRQNMFLFVNKETVGSYPNLQKFIGLDTIIDVVHPLFRGVEGKHIRLFDLLSEWILDELSGRRMAAYLEQQEIRKVAIYGMGGIGNILLKLLSGTQIHVKYVIDRAQKEIPGVSCFPLSDSVKLPPVQAVIVTPIWDFDAIKNGLEAKLDSQILNFEDLVSKL